MSNDVSVTIDVANQSITSSDTNIITVPTQNQNFEIVTFDNKPCIRATSNNYATFTISPTIKSLSCDVFLQAVNGFTLFIEFDTVLNTKYSLVYYPRGTWWNPDSAVFDNNNVLVGVWVTVTYSSSNKTITFDNGTNQLVRTIDSNIVDLNIGNFEGRYNIYLTNLGAEISTRYVNKPGVAEIWANIKNWVTAQLLGKSNTGHTHVKNDITDFPTIPTKTSDLTNDSGFLTSHQSLSGYIPTSGGAVMTNYFLGRSVNTGSFMISGGTGWSSGGSIESFGSSHSSYAGQVRIQPALSDSNFKTMTIQSNGTWTWNGSACSVSSDSRLKDEISDISDEVLDAWENLEPKQYKLKSELETDKDNAQIHYGWIAQDVESIIKGNRKGDIKNGLWLHEEWEEQKEVSHEEKYTEEVETKDGKTKTVTKTRKVVDSPYRAKGDSYGLRYTECLVVECKYLRRCIARLTARIEELEKDNNVK